MPKPSKQSAYLKPKFLYLWSAIPVALLWSWLFFIDVARLSSKPATGFITISLVFLIIVGLSSFVFGKTILYLANQPRNDNFVVKFFRIACVWAFAELLVSWLIAVIWMGANGSWDTVFPFASLSPLAMHTPLRYLSRFVGYYGLSGIMVAAVCVLAIRPLRRHAWVVWGGLLALTLLGWSLYAKTNGSTIQTTIVAEKLGKPQKINAGSSQLVVLPEYSLDQIEAHEISKHLVSNANSTAYFVGTRQVISTNGIKNTLVIGSTKDGFLRQETKSRLIPGGEYLPYIAAPIVSKFDSVTYADFQVRRAVTKGNQPITPYIVSRDLVLGSGACSSIIAAQDYRRLTREGATVLTNSASLDIFAGSRLFEWQQNGLAKFMAVANARTFVQSAADGPAYVIDTGGKQIAKIQPTSTKQVTITTNHKRTPYAILGEWMPFLGFGFLVFDTTRSIVAKTGKKKH